MVSGTPVENSEKWFSSLCDFAFQKSSRILRAHRHKKSSRQSHTGTFGTNRNLKSRFRDFIKRFLCSNRGMTRAPGVGTEKNSTKATLGKNGFHFCQKSMRKTLQIPMGTLGLSRQTGPMAAQQARTAKKSDYQNLRTRARGVGTEKNSHPAPTGLI